MERDRWIRERTFDGRSEDPERLAAERRASGLTVTVCLPARDVEATVGPIVAAIRERFVDRVGLVDEVIVIDGFSSDATRARATEAGAQVHAQAEILPTSGTHGGKGEALWKSLSVARGDLIAWIDSDIVDFDPAFVPGLLGPLIRVPEIAFVKGNYRRSLGTDPSGGGRVTELCARPLLNLLFPDLAAFGQPLAGETAGRRAHFERLPFLDGYGVEIGLLIDSWRRVGLAGMAQSELGARQHVHQPTLALGPMAQIVARAILDRAGLGDALAERYVRPAGGSLAGQDVALTSRPPLRPA